MKRGDITFSGIIFAVIRFSVLLFVAIMFLLFISLFTRNSIDTFNAESEILVQGILRSVNGISYAENGRVYPGVVDLEQLAHRKLNETFFHKDNRFASARIQLLGSDGKPYKDMAAVYLNKEVFIYNYQLSRTRFPGVGSAQRKEKTFPIMIRDGGRMSQGFLNITVALPNS